MRATLKAIAAAALAAIAMPAFAAGGAHVVDDAAVETPGTCHVETWVTRSSGDGTLVNVGPACTRRSWPNVELGGFIAYSRAGRTDETAIGLTPKFVFRSEDTGLGIGLATSIGFSLTQRRLESASAIVPFTIPVAKRLRVNINAGWQWSQAGDTHDGFLGGQAEFALTPGLNLMIESFARDKGKPGGQVGLRWTPGGGRVDLDLIGGRYVDGATRSAVTLGLTLRR